MHFLVVSDESLTVNPLIQCDECDHLANSAESLNCHKEEQIFSILKSFFSILVCEGKKVLFTD